MLDDAAVIFVNLADELVIYHSLIDDRLGFNVSSNINFNI